MQKRQTATTFSQVQAACDIIRANPEERSIDFTVAGSPLGALLVAATARGVCRVMIGDDDRALERELRLEYPRAEIRRSIRRTRAIASCTVKPRTSLLRSVLLDATLM
jgi:hypothetical protein